MRNKHPLNRMTLTNFPQLHPQVPIRIKLPRKPPTLVKNTHEPQEMLCRNRIVHVVIL